MRMRTTTWLIAIIVTASGILACSFAAPDATFQQVTEWVKPATVRIESHDGANSSIGTGCILTPDGYVLTCAHVVDSAKSILVKFADNTQAPAAIVRSDPRLDLAILKVSTLGLPCLRLGDSGKLKSGEPVLMLGCPQGLDVTASAGVVGNEKSSIMGRKVIQFSIPVDQGCSGGPLITQTGEVVGLVSATLQGAKSYGFAIPSNEFADFLESSKVTPQSSLGYQRRSRQRSSAGTSGSTPPLGLPARKRCCAIRFRVSLTCRARWRWAVRNISCWTKPAAISPYQTPPCRITIC